MPVPRVALQKLMTAIAQKNKKSEKLEWITAIAVEKLALNGCYYSCQINT